MADFDFKDHSPTQVISLLHTAVAQVCPIYGVSVGDWSDRSTWRVDFRDEATEEQRAAAAQVILDFGIHVGNPEDVGAPVVVQD